MFVLAHLSDPHLGPLPQPKLRELAGKRVIGFINWRRNRHGHHLSDVLDAIVSDMKANAPDHITVTGDLVNIALDDEFDPARKWLARVGAPEHVTLVPGNHDAYVRGAVQQPLRHWGDYMRGDGIGIGAPPEQAVHFPFVRRRGAVALVGLSTAVPTAPFMATGRLGADQLMRLADTLAHLRHERACRVILIHHPPVPPQGSRFKRLVDASAFAHVVAEHGAELILHGHEHVHSLTHLAGPNGRIPVVGVPSASATLHGDREPAAYNLYRISGEPGAFRCEVLSRGFRHGDSGIVDLMNQVLFG